MMSAEWPDLPFVPPRAYGRGRDGKGVRYLVVHYTAGSEHARSAEDGAAYDQRREDGTSAHYYVDQDSVVQCVLTSNRSNTAYHKANRLGIHYELCGTAQTRAQWLDAASDATITRAARQMARDAAKYGIPIRRLSVAETRAAWYSWPAGPRGIVGHGDVTAAYPEDGGDHDDPGPAFPWDVLLARVAKFMGGGDGGDVSFDEPIGDSYAPSHAYGQHLPKTGIAYTWAGVDKVNGKVDELLARPVAPPVVLSDAQVAALAAQVAQLLGPTLVDAARQGAELAEDS